MSKVGVGLGKGVGVPFACWFCDAFTVPIENRLALIKSKTPSANKNMRANCEARG